MYVVILNFESVQIEVLDLCNMPNEADAYEFIEETLDYNLSNCQWMLVNEKPILQFLN